MTYEGLQVFLWQTKKIILCLLGPFNFGFALDPKKHRTSQSYNKCRCRSGGRWSLKSMKLFITFNELDGLLSWPKWLYMPCEASIYVSKLLLHLTPSDLSLLSLVLGFLVRSCLCIFIRGFLHLYGNGNDDLKN